MSKSLLAEIVTNKRAEVERAKIATPEELIRETLEPSQRDFRAALMGGREAAQPKLIAEYKRQSPSGGQLTPARELEETIEFYNQYASAISILTDFKYFGGSLEDLGEADMRTTLPILRKDFIVDPYQLLEARQFGADAVLLIAAILEAEEIKNLLAESQKLGLDALVEVHTAAELKKVLQTPAEIIGINNRNLDTLQIDLQTTLDLAIQIPKGKVIISESGISSANDIAKLTGKVDAILVGTSILQNTDIKSKLGELTGKQ